MGSITSRPKVPQAQRPVVIAMPAPVYYPPAQPYNPPPTQNAPAAPPPGGSAPTNTGGGANDSVPVGEEAQRLAREDSLLRRGRGRLGTILTGFSGLLSQTIAGSNRKTLLGE